MEDDVLAINESFYEAVRAGDLAGLARLWARRVAVACVHPGWPAVRGRDRVLASWRAIFANGAPALACVAPAVSVAGEAAVVVCEERVGGVRLVATNVFVVEDGRWVMTHHHAGPVMGARAESDDDDDDDAGAGGRSDGPPN